MKGREPRQRDDAFFERYEKAYYSLFPPHHVVKVPRSTFETSLAGVGFLSGKCQP